MNTAKLKTGNGSMSLESDLMLPAKPSDVSTIGALLLVSGIISCFWGVGILFATCGLWIPGYCFGIGAGVYAITKGLVLIKDDCRGAGVPSRAAILQTIQYANFDIISGTIGFIVLVILNNPEVKDYLTGSPAAKLPVQASKGPQKEAVTAADDDARRQFEAFGAEPGVSQKTEHLNVSDLSEPAVTLSSPYVEPQWEYAVSKSVEVTASPFLRDVQPAASPQPFSETPSELHGQWEASRPSAQDTVAKVRSAANPTSGSSKTARSSDQYNVADWGANPASVPEETVEGRGEVFPPDQREGAHDFEVWQTEGVTSQPAQVWSSTASGAEDVEAPDAAYVSVPATVTETSGD